MAVRFDASGEAYTRTISLAPLTAFSVTCWLKISVDRNTLSSVWSLDNSFASAYALLQTDVDGTTLLYSDGPANRTLGALTVGTWCHVGIAVNGANGTAVLRRVGDTTTTVTTWSNGQASTNADTLRISNSVFSGQFMNGCVAAFKLWTGAALSQGELEAEIWSYMPQRTANLKAWYPLLVAETVDYSGNAQTLSGGVGASTEDGPPITWGPRRKAFYAPAPTSTPKSLADSGTAADDVSVAVDVPLADSSTASDSIAVTADVPLSDDAIAVDDITISVTVAMPEDATAADSFLVGSPIPLADSATADDTWTVVPTPVVDEQATADDQITITATVALADSATATDQLDVTELVFVTLADTASASDAINVVVPSDVTVIARLERGWDAGAPAGLWDSAEPEHGWEPATPERAWVATGAGRGWDADPPTL